MLKTIFVAFLSFNFFFGNGTGNLLTTNNQNGKKSDVGTLEKMIVAEGNAAIDLDLNQLNGRKGNGLSSLRFEVENNSFFTIMVYNGELRGPLPSSMKLVPRSFANLPAALGASYQRLILEKTDFTEANEFVIRDGKTGFVFFYIEGQQFDYQPNDRQLNIQTGRVLVSKEFARELGRSTLAGTVVGQISINATMRPIEVSEVVNGEIKSESIPADDSKLAGTRPGPDVVVGDIIGMQQFGSSGTQVGLAIGTTSCNYGTVNLNWFQNPSNDHPVIPQNLYRMSGGSDNAERFEQIGQSQVKHAFTALTQNICGLGCNGVGGSQLGSGCSDPYTASLNAGPNLGSKAWINPFTGEYPRNDSATPNNSHTGHSHSGISHRLIVEQNNLNTTMNAGATYYAEGQYVTPHEYAWCQANPTQCNMNNNVSYRQYTVSGTTSFSFSAAASTVREKAAIEGWTGATVTRIEPAPGVDGIGFVGYKVTNPSAGVWHYEYAIYNQNLDRGIQSFSVPLGNGITLSNVGFYAPPQHPGTAGDGTAGNAGFSNAAWSQTQTTSEMAWNSETMALNANANAIRWGTMYNFRFDSNRPPQNVNATIGFFKTGSPMTIQVQGPTPAAASAVSVAGRVATPGGKGISNALVTITNGSTTLRTTTGVLGNFRFDNVNSGGSYTITVQSGRYTFAPQVIQVENNISGLSFLSQQER